MWGGVHEVGVLHAQVVGHGLQVTGAAFLAEGAVVLAFGKQHLGEALAVVLEFGRS